MDTEQEVFQVLGDMGATELLAINLEMKVDVSGKEGNRVSLYKSLLRFLTSEEVEKADDGGEQYFQKVLALIQKLQATKTPKSTIFGFSPQEKDDSSLFDQPKPLLDDEKRLENMFMKQFKISGKIAGTGKEALTYSSLIFQIQSGIKKGYSEVSIVDAVVKAVSHESELRQYLERKEGLDLAALSKALRFLVQGKRCHQFILKHEYSQARKQ